MKKVVLFLFLILFSSTFTFAVELHNASEVYLNINGQSSVNLESAYLNGLLIGNNDYSVVDDPNNPGHTVDKVWVSTGEGEMSFLDALNNAQLIDGLSTYNSVLNEDDGWHYANEIIFSNGKTLQDVVTFGEICTRKICSDFSGQEIYDDGCGGQVDCRPECEINYVAQDYKECYDSDGDGDLDSVRWIDSCGDPNYDGSEYCGEDELGSWGSWSCDHDYGGGNDATRTKTDILRGCGTSTGIASCYESTEVSSETEGRSECPEGVAEVSAGIAVGATLVGCAVGGPAGCFIGGAVGLVGAGVNALVGSGGGGGSVICTELYEIGLMDEETYKMDSEFASSHVSKEALQGYRAWGNTVVKLMREDERILSVSNMMVQDFTDEIAYRMGKSEESNEAGALYLDEAMPLFERIGVLIDEPMLPEFLRRNPNNEIVESYFTEEKVSELFYEALGNKTEPDMEFNKKYLELMSQLVEEIEAEVEGQ